MNKKYPSIDGCSHRVLVDHWTLTETPHNWHSFFIDCMGKTNIKFCALIDGHDSMPNYMVRRGFGNAAYLSDIMV
jgi:hypothetical protein